MGGRRALVTARCIDGMFVWQSVGRPPVGLRSKVATQRRYEKQSVKLAVVSETGHRDKKPVFSTELTFEERYTLETTDAQDDIVLDKECVEETPNIAGR